MLFHIDHPDDERFDEIHISVVERWKESELSGDEWRFSYLAEIKRKGEIIIRITASTLDWLLKGLQWRIQIAGEKANLILMLGTGPEISATSQGALMLLPSFIS